MTPAARLPTRRWPPVLAAAICLGGAAAVAWAQAAPDALAPLDRPAIQDALASAYDDIDARPSARERILRFIGDLLLRAFGAAFGRDDGLGLLLAVAALALLTVAAWWLYRRLGLVAAPTAAGAAGTAPDRRIDWNHRAQEARARGDLETAVRAGWRYLLQVLDDRGVLREAPSLTATETAEATQRADPGLGPAVAAAADAFEHVVFADEPATAGHDDRVRQAAQQVERR
ncbi:MAG TPA: DUF4129 domain-containing protein [Nitriliruptorales bacterium]